MLSAAKGPPVVGSWQSVTFGTPLPPRILKNIHFCGESWLPRTRGVPFRSQQRGIAIDTCTTCCHSSRFCNLPCAADGAAVSSFRSLSSYLFVTTLRCHRTRPVNSQGLKAHLCHRQVYSCSACHAVPSSLLRFCPCSWSAPDSSISFGW